MTRVAYSLYMTPVKTPVRLPRRDSGSMPARSTASQEVSSINRCWGSMARASWGEMLNSDGSKSATPSMNPPSRENSTSAARPVVKGVMSQPRSVGNSPIASAPSRTRRHSASGESTPPGKRQDMPMMAIGSCSVDSAARSR